MVATHSLLHFSPTHSHFANRPLNSMHRDDNVKCMLHKWDGMTGQNLLHHPTKQFDSWFRICVGIVNAIQVRRISFALPNLLLSVYVRGRIY